LEPSAAERTHSVSESLQRGFRAADALELKTKFTVYGESLTTVRCDVASAAGIRVAGKGKGVGEQSTVSALFEALEHYCYCVGSATSEFAKKLGELPSDDEIIDGSPNFSLFSVSDAPPLSRVLFRRISGDPTELAAPAFLFDPDFVSRSHDEAKYLRATRLCRYSTNSGTAAGTCSQDAQLHAVMELVERDALSIELLLTIFSANPRAVRGIGIRSLTPRLRQLVSSAESESGGKVSIWWITADVPIPVVLVKLSDPHDPEYGYFGSGASLQAPLAVERALTEAVQGFHVYRHELTKPKLRTVGRLKRRTPFQRCLLEFGLFEFEGGEEEISMPDPAASELGAALTVEEQLDRAIRLLGERGIAIYERSLYSSHDLAVVQIYAPKLERFFLATAGLLVAPGARGKELLKQHGRSSKEGHELKQCRADV
jgi:ribosomal protein S12 methylthiotransferase accessory factor